MISIDFMIFMGHNVGHQISSKRPSKSMKSSPIRSIIDAIEIERAQIVQNSPMNLSFFERFSEKPTKTPARPKKSIFLALFRSAVGFPWISLNLSIFINFLRFCLCRAIVRHFCAHFVRPPKQADFPAFPALASI